MARVVLESAIDIPYETEAPFFLAASGPWGYSQFPEDPIQDGHFTTQDIGFMFSTVDLSDVVHGKTNPIHEILRLQAKAIGAGSRIFGTRYDFRLDHEKVKLQTTPQEQISYVQRLLGSSEERRAFLKYVVREKAPPWTLSILKEVLEKDRTWLFFPILENLPQEDLLGLFSSLGRTFEGSRVAAIFFIHLAQDPLWFRKILKGLARFNPALAARILVHAKHVAQKTYHPLFYHWLWHSGLPTRALLEKVILYEFETVNGIEQTYKNPITALRVQDRILELFVVYLENPPLSQDKAKLIRGLEILKGRGWIQSFQIVFEPSVGREIKELEVIFPSSLRNYPSEAKVKGKERKEETNSCDDYYYGKEGEKRDREGLKKRCQTWLESRRRYLSTLREEELYSMAIQAMGISRDIWAEGTQELLRREKAKAHPKMSRLLEYLQWQHRASLSADAGDYILNIVGHYSAGATSLFLEKVGEYESYLEGDSNLSWREKRTIQNFINEIRSLIPQTGP